MGSREQTREWLYQSPRSKGEAGRLDPGNLCGPSSILPPPRRDGGARDPPAIPSQQRRLLTWRGRHSLWTEAIAALILGNKNKVPGVP